jgi:hypothetical protein
MYDLSVADAHTYFVGDDAWLVHNCPTDDYLQPPLFPENILPRPDNVPPPDIRARELADNNLRPGHERNNVTIGIGDIYNPNTGEIYRVVSISDREGKRTVESLIPHDALKDFEWTVPPQGGTGHAEDNIVRWAEARNWQVLEVGASLPICTTCQTTIQGAGGTPVGELKQ